MKNHFFIGLSLFVLVYTTSYAQIKSKIIDMHIHAYQDDHFAFPVRDYWGNAGAANATAHFEETMSAFKKYNITKAVVSGSPAAVESWKAKDTDQRIIRGIAMDFPNDFNMDSVTFENMVKQGKIQVFGELGTYYSGTTLADAVWQPYLRICEKYDIPVAVHTGGGDPGGTYTWSPKARLVYGDPYLIEDVLVRYPKLRVYLMHAGEVWHEHALRLMAYYPQLYTDIAVLLWVEPLTQRYAREFLRNAKEAGLLKRVMFGTDQMRWPYAIEKSIQFLNNLDFLTAQEKQDIFYNNAAAFLKIKQ
jgi:predicted TIM-barrel fold metal-dependent hydrolase